MRRFTDIHHHILYGMDDGAQAVFFSMLFPQLAPGGGEATPGEAVAL